MNYLIVEEVKSSKLSIGKRKQIFDLYVNDAPFQSSIVRDGLRINHEGYQAWIHMIHRVHGKSSDRYTTYKKVKICEEWRSFMAFRDWWVLNYIPGWCLDKDILGLGNIYSPESCIYIPQWLNKILNTSPARRGKYALGVSRSGNKYVASVSNPVTGIHEKVGYFKSEQEARDAWIMRKNEVLLSMKPQIDLVDTRLFGIISHKLAVAV